MNNKIAWEGELPPPMRPERESWTATKVGRDKQGIEMRGHDLIMKERKALYDALAAWRSVLWERILFKSPRQYLPQVNKWEKVLARHLEATRDLPGDF